MEYHLSEEEIRQELITSKCDLTIGFADEGLRELTLFVNTIEELISTEESKSVSNLSEIAEREGIRASGEFWSENYPYWWQDVFASRLRSSYIISLMSAVEQHLQAVSRDVYTILGSGIRPNDISGGTIERSRKYLEKVANFSVPSPKVWELVSYIYDIRNALVHNGGVLRDGKLKRRVNHLVNIAPGLKIEHEMFIDITKDFIEFANSSVEKLFGELAQGLRQLCKQRQI